jgi:hypothetical protein
VGDGQDAVVNALSGWQTRSMPKNPRRGVSNSGRPGPGYLGGLVAEQPVVIRDSNVVAYTSHITAYPEGFLFTAFVELASDDGPVPNVEPQIAVRFPDDRTWATFPYTPGERLVPCAGQTSSGPAGASWCMEYWIPDLPPRGQVTFTVTVGPIEGSATLDGAAIIEASSRATNLWEIPPEHV